MNNVDEKRPPAERQVTLDEQVAPVTRVYGPEARVPKGVSFEEFAYWAKLDREEENMENIAFKEAQGPMSMKRLVTDRFSSGRISEHTEEKPGFFQSLKGKLLGNSGSTASVSGSTGNGMEVPAEASKGDVETTAQMRGEVEAEWKTASRALRTASWGSVFYLITTDILGWSSTPFVFASVGFGPGVALYVVFGAFAGFSGWMLWQVFLGLSSARFPMSSFGDTYYRVFGAKSRHFINIMQSLQQFMTVAVLVLGQATTLSQMSKDSLCFIVAMVIIMIIGMVFGTIRSLNHVGWMANLSVWMNIACFLMVMVASATKPIDYDAVTRSTRIKDIEPIKLFGGLVPDKYQQQAAGFAGVFNGVNQLVYSYGGAILFIAFMAEMRHPWDFWKALLCAQAFICCVYIFFGAFVYGHYGQYSASNISSVIQPYSLQTANNALAFITGMIACIMYFNVGMKTVYIEVCEEILRMPSITTRKGRWCWYLLGPVYWIVAFVVAAAVPNLNGISSLVGAFLILNFTYTFPAFLYVGYRCQIDAALPGEGFDPATNTTTRLDSGPKRWIRGFMKNWHLNTFNLLYGMGGLACSGMGAWAAIEGLISVFGPGGTVATSFGCAVPV